ncbi:hypothetical protein [Hymenobacter metallicola]|uniref:Uncharacterized protein n=1 Tax=Hymenobacter metallicola TaxID=2563114 RepID=A0A4Z0Q1Z6_9BACT|nr:hypothetical protein [Hymenobacter metallicola]TGE23519.1 hypothetical protein E5K02_20240 [Hymenobacter metallicola]
MLHLLYPQLADHLRVAVPALGTIDLDMAQLDYQSNEPIRYPAVYIDLEDIPWRNLGGGIQTGRALLRFTVATEVSEETHQGSEQQAAAVARLLVVQEVHAALQHFQGEGFGPLVRTSYRRDRPQHPEAWCMALGYVTEVKDEDGAKRGQLVHDVQLNAGPGVRPASVPDDEPFVLPS